MFKLDMTTKPLSSAINPRLAFTFMLYAVLVVSTIVLFEDVVTINLFSIMSIKVSGCLFPYVFLYPLSFIVLRLYGYRNTNIMIGSMMITTLIFVLIVQSVGYFSEASSQMINTYTGINKVYEVAFKMYLAGFIAMPAGIYMSFLAMSLFTRINIGFNLFTLSIATIIGEIANTFIAFPLGLFKTYDFATIFSQFILGALIFKIIAAIILSIPTAIFFKLYARQTQ